MLADENHIAFTTPDKYLAVVIIVTVWIQINKISKQFKLIRLFLLFPFHKEVHFWSLLGMQSDICVTSPFKLMLKQRVGVFVESEHRYQTHSEWRMWFKTSSSEICINGSKTVASSSLHCSQTRSFSIIQLLACAITPSLVCTCFSFFISNSLRRATVTFT